MRRSQALNLVEPVEHHSPGERRHPCQPLRPHVVEPPVQSCNFECPLQTPDQSGTVCCPFDNHFDVSTYDTFMSLWSTSTPVIRSTACNPNRRLYSRVQLGAGSSGLFCVVHRAVVPHLCIRASFTRDVSTTVYCLLCFGCTDQA